MAPLRGSGQDVDIGVGPTSCLTGWATSPGSGPDGGGESVGVILKNIDLVRVKTD